MEWNGGIYKFNFRGNQRFGGVVFYLTRSYDTCSPRTEQRGFSYGGDRKNSSLFEQFNNNIRFFFIVPSWKILALILNSALSEEYCIFALLACAGNVSI